MGGKRLAKPDRNVLVLDHAVPCPNERIAGLHKLMRDFAREQEAVLFEQNEGVCHQVMIERGFARSGRIIVGADSHTCSYGAVGAFAMGVGSTDLGAVLKTGKIWIRVPESISIELHGALPKGVTAKDVILRIIGDVTADGATYLSVEYGGDGFDRFTLDERITVSNMTVEMGAKTGVFLSAINEKHLLPDANASYNRKLIYRAADMVPVISCPHTVDNVDSVKRQEGKKVDLVYIGSCTNARASDLEQAANILKGRHLAPGVRMIVCPASKNVLMASMKSGAMEALISAGATFITPGCGLCVGTLGGIPSDGETVISTSNRNFLGRMGNNKAEIYLASPLTAAAAALTGRITDPREVLM